VGDHPPKVAEESAINKVDIISIEAESEPGSRYTISTMDIMI